MTTAQNIVAAREDWATAAANFGGIFADQHARRYFNGDEPADAARISALAGGAFVGGGGGQKPYETDGPVAVIEINGLIVPWLGWIGSSYVTGCNGLQYQIGAALADPSVRAVVLRVDSGGGYVAMTGETAEWIMRAKAAAGKPIKTLVNTSAYSAAYWLACAGDEIVVTPSCGVGSIGVYALHLDFSENLTKAGIKATIIRAGSRKAEANLYEPLTDAARAGVQDAVDSARRRFVDFVSAARRIPAQAVLETQARVFDEAAELAAAKSLGLIDRIEIHPDAAMAGWKKQYS